MFTKLYDVIDPWDGFISDILAFRATSSFARVGYKINEISFFVVSLYEWNESFCRLPLLRPNFSINYG